MGGVAAYEPGFRGWGGAVPTANWRTVPGLQIERQEARTFGGHIRRAAALQL
jgi:hypothetical protein